MTCDHRHIGGHKCCTYRFDTLDTFSFADPHLCGLKFLVRVHPKALRFTWDHNRMSCGRWSRYYEIAWTRASIDGRHMVRAVADETCMSMDKAADHICWLADRLADAVSRDKRAQSWIVAAYPKDSAVS